MNDILTSQMNDILTLSGKIHLLCKGIDMKKKQSHFDSKSLFIISSDRFLSFLRISFTLWYSISFLINEKSSKNLRILSDNPVNSRMLRFLVPVALFGNISMNCLLKLIAKHVPWIESVTIQEALSINARNSLKSGQQINFPPRFIWCNIGLTLNSSIPVCADNRLA